MSDFKVQITAASMDDLYEKLADERPLLFGDLELNRAARSVLQAGLDWLGHGKDKNRLLQLEHRLEVLASQVGARVSGGQFSLDFQVAKDGVDEEAEDGPEKTEAAEEDGGAAQIAAGDEDTSVDAGKLATKAWIENLRREVLHTFANADHEAEGVEISDSGSLVIGKKVLNPEVIEVEPWAGGEDILCLLLYAQANDGDFHVGSLLAVRNVGVVSSRQVVFADIGGYKSPEEACRNESKAILVDLKHLIDGGRLDANAAKVFTGWAKQLFPAPAKKKAVKAKDKDDDTAGQ